MKTIEEYTLKPCTSCGRDLASIRYHEFGCHSIECNNCHLQTAEYGGAQSAEVWNSQPENDRLVQDNKSLRESEIALVNETEDLKCEVEDLREALVSLDAIASLMGSAIYEGSLLQAQVGKLLNKGE